MRDLDDMRAAARDLHAAGAAAVLLKGGALESGEAIDVFCDRRGLVELAEPRIDTRNVHGAGCTLSAAICARLARGERAAGGDPGRQGLADRRPAAVVHGRARARARSITCTQGDDGRARATGPRASAPDPVQAGGGYRSALNALRPA